MKYSLDAIKNVNYVIDYYKILEIPVDASSEVIKKSYKKLAREYHPDKVQTSGEEIKKLAEKKILLITEAHSVLSNAALKKDYDQLLSKFKDEKPQCISSDGTPILDVHGESFNLDFIVSGALEFDFKESQEEKAHQLIGHNETVFNTIESAFLSDPKNSELKKAYQEQLLRKKLVLDWEETFAWQELGVLNNKDVKIQMASDYLLKVKEKLDKTTKEYKQLATTRLLPGTEPLLLGTSSSSNSNVVNVEEINNAIDEKVKERSQKLLDIAKKKEEFLKKMVKIRTYHKIKESTKKDLIVLVVNKGVVLSSFSLAFTDETPEDLKMDSSFDNMKTEDVLINEDINAYILEYNPELDLSFQLMEFVTDLVNS